MLESRNGVERNGHNRPFSIVFIGGDEQTLTGVTQSINLRWPLASTKVAPTGAAGLTMVSESSPDLVLVHTELRDMFAQVLVEELRRFSGVPILVLTRELDDTEAVSALELGADDYVQYPCGTWQLVARIWAVLRRSGMIPFHDEKQSFLISGRLFIDPAGYEVFLDDQKVYLTPTEFRLLYLLAKNHGKVISHQMLEKEIWGGRPDNLRSAKKHIQRLRWKLEDRAVSPLWIANVYGVGYRFVGPRPRWQGPFPGN